ncbi:MAG: Lrp/AsnC family transcriptional regulator [Candidatus Dormibacteraceae bacterium]
MAAKRSEAVGWEPGALALDAVDLAVLDELLRDARASRRGIARAVGMSAPAVGERIARLERAGVITGYRAVIDRQRLGFPVTAYISVETFQVGPHPVQVLAELSQVPEVEEVSIVTGPMDLMLRLRVHDHEQLRRALLAIWDLEGVRHTETFLSLQEGRTRDTDADLVQRLREDLERPKPS